MSDGGLSEDRKNRDGVAAGSATALCFVFYINVQKFKILNIFNKCSIFKFCQINSIKKPFFLAIFVY